MLMNKLLKIIYTTILISTLTACGGGGTNNGGSPDSPTSPNENTSTPNSPLSSHVRLKKTTTSTDDGFIYTSTYEYNSKNRAKKMISVTSDQSHQEFSRTTVEFEYNSANNLIKMTSSAFPGYHKFIPTPDNKRLQKEIIYDNDNNLLAESEVMERDDRGRPTLIIGKNPSGEIFRRIYNTYDENGDLAKTEIESYSPNSTSVETFIREFTYDLTRQPLDLHTTGNYSNTTAFEDFPKHDLIKTVLTQIGSDSISELLSSTTYNDLNLPVKSNIKYYVNDVLKGESNTKFEYENAN